jgi:UDP-N-acetylglucosamine 2-epimerase (non-hydrolysing)
MKVILVAGARPNFVKIAPLLRAMHLFNKTKIRFFEPMLVHTGQHYDYEMSKVFFQDLELPKPDIYLGIGSGSHAEQTGKVMIEFEEILSKKKPDLVVVVGDVNSTLAAALAAVKLHIPIAHVEAGLRSYDRNMPEEINRLLTDTISDYLFTPSPDANDNLKREGIAGEKIFFVGNIMVDSLLHSIRRTIKEPYPELKKGEYAVLTLHRPESVDDATTLHRLLQAVGEVSKQITIVFPVHPRSKKNIADFGLSHLLENTGIILTKPLGYLDFIKLEMDARFVMTDSGGVQEETTVLNIPCLTLRKTSERPITITQGSNTLVGNDSGAIVTEASKILDGKGKKGNRPELWDGKAAERMVDILVR